MRKITTFLLCAIICLFSTRTFAEPLHAPVIDYSSNTMTIGGKVDESFSGRLASLQVLNPGKSFADLMSDSDVLNWSDEVCVADDGSFSFQVAMDGDTGVYTYFIGIEGMTETLYGEPLMYYGTDEVDAVWNKIKTALKDKDAAMIKWVIENRSVLLQIDTSAYDELSKTDKERVCKGIATTSQINTVNEFKNVFESAIIVNKIKDISDLTEYEKESAELFSMASEYINSLYDDFSEQEKSAVLTVLMDGDIYNAEEFLSVYTYQVMLIELNSKKLRTEMDDFIRNGAKLTEDELEVYLNLKYPAKVAQALLEALPFSSMEEFKTKLASEALKQKNSENSSNNAGNTSRSSGGNGGGFSYAAPAGKVVTENSVTDPSGVTQSSFSDLSGFEWAADDIYALVEMKAISGDGTGRFNPHAFVTRAELLKMAVQAFGFAQSEESSPFTDVSANAWYYTVVNTAYSNGIIKGTGGNTFDPDSFITRQDLAVLIYNAAQKSGLEFGEHTNTFKDLSQISEYAVKAVSALSGTEIIKGYEDDTFRPYSHANRAEAAVIISRIINCIQEAK